MRKVSTLLFVMLLANFLAYSQDYKPTWESLDSRATPSWYGDAKFGIFIHWGLYSVPSYSVKGSYAEWYQYHLEGDSSYMYEAQKKKYKTTNKFHKENYAQDTEYSDFRKGFTNEFFQPKEWASLFKRSGAKYVVLTSWSSHSNGT